MGLFKLMKVARNFLKSMVYLVGSDSLVEEDSRAKFGGHVYRWNLFSLN